MNEHATFAKIRAVAQRALPAAERLVAAWLPEGKRQGSEWVARNPARGDRAAGSFGVSLVSGKWNDFASHAAHGGDLVSLYAYLHGCRQVDAAMAIDRALGLGAFTSSSSPSVSEAALESTEAIAERAQRERQAQAEQRRRHRDAERRARWLWDAAQPASPSHPYLVAKALPPFKLRQGGDGTLFVPLYGDGRLMNLQCIGIDGRKRFLRGGRVAGAYATLGRVTQGAPLFICEGWATGATLHHVTGRAVACAMHAGNLAAVVARLRERYGGAARLIVTGDDDRQTDGNPGRQAAIVAAEAHGARVVFPRWPAGSPDGLTDFNDLYRWRLGRLPGPSSQAAMNDAFGEEGRP